MEPIAQAGAVKSLENCTVCGAQLAVIRDKVWTQPDPRKDPVIEDSDRGRRGVYVGCGACRTPVPPTHPRQLELDRQWAEQDRKDREEAERRAKARPMPTIPHVDREQLIVDLLAPMQKRLTALEAEVAMLKQQAAVSKKR